MFAIFSIFYAYARSIIKWFLRHFTRLCELQRICYGCESGAKRKKGVEQSLLLSRTLKIQQLIQQLDDRITEKIPRDDLHQHVIPNAVSTVLKVKRIKPKFHPDFGPSLRVCIESIWSYRRLCADVEVMRQIHYDGSDLDHEKKLLKLWHLLMPDEPLENRISKQWQDIGFQGDNPSTDFRGKICCLNFK